MPQQCSSCSHPSPDGAKFCLECGTPFARTCPSCGHPVAGGKFCMECGTPLNAAAAPPPAPTGTLTAPGASAPVSERRTTTVLFGDLVSFTTLSESRDPEEVRELLSEYFAVARTVVGRYGGTIEKFIGDAVMAVWGVPVSHEDDAERAVRAGLDLVAEVAALGASVGAPELSMRVGIVTGSVAVTLGAVNEGMVAGDAVNTAARVQTAATPGTVWTDQETRGLTAAAVAYSDMGEHVLKGKAEPARLFRADAIVAAVGGAQRVDGLEAPLTGRDGELRRLKELFHATQGDGRSRIVVVSGMAGVGKSRLGWEFEKYTDGLSDSMWWHRGRCLSYGDGVAYWAFAEMVRSRLGLLEDEDRAAVRARVRDRVAEFARDDEEAAWLTSRLGALLGLGDGTVFDRTDLFAAWTTFVDRVGRNDEPVVLLFEDCQHADPALLDLVEHVLESSRARVFLLVFARPELLEQRPSLAAGRRACVINLEPLPDDAMGTLVDGLVADLPGRARTAVVARAEGVPLYAVETVRSLIDRDAVVARGGRYVFVDHDHSLVDLDQLAAPTSLQTLIAARLDALTPTERRAVQDASVLGVSFRQPGLMALADVSSYELDGALAGLVRKGVIEAQSDPRSPERGQYRFLQALVREVAYSTLARRDRRLRHLAAADHLEAESEETSAALSGIIAQHLLDALAATSSTDQDRGVVAGRARALLVSTAERAESLGSTVEALHAVRTALSLDPPPDELVALQESSARVATAAGEHAQSVEAADEAAAGHERAGDTMAVARVLQVKAMAQLALGRHADGAETARAGLALLDTLPEDPAMRLDLLRALTASLRFVGDSAELRALVIEMGRRAEDLGEPGRLVNALNTLGIVLIDAGLSTAYLALLEKCVEIAREERLLSALGRSLANLLAELYPYDLTRSRELAGEAIAVSTQVGESFYTETALVNAGFTWWLRGDWDQVVDVVGTWLWERPLTSASGSLGTAVVSVRLARGEEPDIGLELPDSEDEWEQYCKDLVLALVRADQGDVAGAAESVRASVRAVFSGDVFDDFEMLWAPAVELQLRAGDLDEAEALLALAGPLLGGRGRPLTRGEHPRLRGMILAARGQDPEADLRSAERAHAAYGAPYLLARTRLELGRWLAGQGRHEEATPVLAAAREAFVSLSAAPSVAEVDALAPVVVPV